MATIRELQEQMKALQEQIEAQKKQELPAVIAEIKQKIAEYGVTPEQIFDDLVISAPRQNKSPERSSKNKVEMKYEFEGVQWSGRGKIPTPMQVEIDKGRAKSKDDFLIKK